MCDSSDDDNDDDSRSAVVHLDADGTVVYDVWRAAAVDEKWALFFRLVRDSDYRVESPVCRPAGLKLSLWRVSDRLPASALNPRHTSHHWRPNVGRHFIPPPSILLVAAALCFRVVRPSMIKMGMGIEIRIR